MDREAAWDALHDALPARWRLGPPGYDPGTRRWEVSALGPHPGRGKIRGLVLQVGRTASECQHYDLIVRSPVAHRLGAPFLRVTSGIPKLGHEQLLGLELPLA